MSHPPSNGTYAQSRMDWVSRWAPVAGAVALIFFVSSIPRLQPPVGWRGIDKLAHIAEYAALGLLIRRGFRRPGWRGWVAAAASAALAGLADEGLQSRVPGRFASWLDWGADLAGSALGSAAQPALARRVRGDSEAGGWTERGGDD